MSTSSISNLGISASTLLSYYQVMALPTQSASTASTAAAATAANPATANDAPPWDGTQPTAIAEDAQVLSTTDFLNTSNVPLTASNANAEVEQDNQKLFSVYQALSSLSALADLAQQSTATAGQIAGYNTRFQAGLSQVESYLQTTSFNNFTLQTSTPSSSTTSAVSMPIDTSTGYTGGTIVNDANVENALPGLTTNEGFNVAITAGGVTTNVPIDFSQISGPLTIDNIVDYTNQQLQADGFDTTFQRTVTEGSIDDPTDASYGIAINPSPTETVSLSALSSAPALYIAGTTGLPGNVTTTTISTDPTTSATTTAVSTGSDQQGRLIKLSGLDGTPQGVFSNTVDSTTGNTTADATAVDANGDVYIIGNATGNFGSQINQGSQDVYLSKYDSAGNLEWTRMLGSAGSASGYGLATTPSGGVVVTGSTTADLTSTAVADGNTDSFVASYDADGNQQWVQQIQTLANNQANAVSVDSSGNIYIGGQVNGVVSAGQTDAGGSDAYITALNASGQILYEQQFGTSGNDQVAATATTSDGSLVVASVQNGDAIVSKYANGNVTQAPVWQVDLGSLQNGTIGGLSVSGNNIYLSGTTANGNLTAGGEATVASPSTGEQDAFVASLTDSGTSVTANQVTYVAAPDGVTDGGGVTVGPDGTVYLTGSTTGTFAGATRNVQGTQNAFVAAINPSGTLDWTQQFGGADDQSTGTGIAIDAQGSSVLDALGLPSGTIDTNNQTVDLTQATTLRAGDSFSIDVGGTVPRDVTITIDQGETLATLANKISAELSFSGNATVSYGSGGESLKIQVDPGVTATLVSGPADSDALSRLGITPGTISNTSGNSTTGNTTQSFGLGLQSGLSLSSATEASFAQNQILSALTTIRNAYQTTNTPPASTTGAAAAATGAGNVSALYQNYSDALSLFTLGAGNASSTGSSTLSLSI